jgi:Spy/CpxP family protein refolding chaperone
MKMGLIVSTLALAALMAAQAPCQALAPSRTNTPAGAAEVQALRQYLDLTDEQTRQLEQLREQTRAAARPAFEHLRANQAKLYELLNRNDKPEASRTGQLVVESNNLRSQLESLRLESATKAGAVLTPEQQQKLVTLLGRIELERQASPQTMPESWPLVHAAADLGLTRPPRVRRSAAREEREGRLPRGDSASPSAALPPR